MKRARIGRRAIAWAACAWLAAAGLLAAQEPAPGIWPAVAGGVWYWVVPKSDVDPGQVEAAFARTIAEGTAFVDSRFSATVFFARKIRLTRGKSGERKKYPDRPEKADDLRIEAEWQNGYLNQYRGQSYCFVPLDSIRSLDLHYLANARERFPKAPPGRNWNVNILADSLYSFFFAMEDTARAFINAVASAMAQRGLELDFSRFGLMWDNITHAQALDMKSAAAGGVLATWVAVGGPADRAGVRALDAILEVNGVPVKNFSHFSMLLEGIAPGSRATLLLLRRLKDARAFPETSGWETMTVEMESR